MKSRDQVIRFIAYTQSCSEEEATRRYHDMSPEKRNRLFGQIKDNRRKHVCKPLSPLSRPRRKRRTFAL